MGFERPTSDRPGLIVDWNNAKLVDPATKTLVGVPGPFGRERVLPVLPMTGALFPPEVIVDSDGFFLADPDGGIVGEPALWVPRMLSALSVENTRRF